MGTQFWKKCVYYIKINQFDQIDQTLAISLFTAFFWRWQKYEKLLVTKLTSWILIRNKIILNQFSHDYQNCVSFILISAQREGFLSEAHSEEVDQADPFYAHCKLHSDKTLVKKRRKNYLSLQLRTHYRRLQMANEDVKNSTEQLRIQRKLEKQRVHYLSLKSLKQPPWGKYLFISI